MLGLTGGHPAPSPTATTRRTWCRSASSFPTAFAGSRDDEHPAGRLPRGPLNAPSFGVRGRAHRTQQELANSAFKEKAVSLVLAGGLIGAVLGPNLALWTKSMFATPFAGAYLALVFVALLSMLVMSFIDFPAHVVKSKADSAKNAGRPLSEIMRQPVFIVSTMAAALGYGVMNLLMAATPIAMQQCGLLFSDVAFVLEWHVIGMFAPGFFTGHLIKRFGVLQIMGVGVVLNLALHFDCVVWARFAPVFNRFIFAGFGLEFLVHR